MPFTHTQQFTCPLTCTAIYLSSPEFYSWCFSSSSGFNRRVYPPRQVVVHWPCQLYQHHPATPVHWTKPLYSKSGLQNPSHFDVSIQGLTHSYIEAMCLLPVTTEIHNYLHCNFTNTAGQYQSTLSSSLANARVDDVSTNRCRSPQHTSLQWRISTLITSIRWLLPTIDHSWEKMQFQPQRNSEMEFHWINLKIRLDIVS